MFVAALVNVVSI